MHNNNNNNYRHRNPIGGFIVFILTMLGILVFIGFITGFIRHFMWPIPMIGTILLIILIISIISSLRRRAYYRQTQRQQFRHYEPYRPTENPFWKNQETSVVHEAEPVQKTSGNSKFCDYCGMKVKEEMRYCTNCGTKLF